MFLLDFASSSYISIFLSMIAPLSMFCALNQKYYSFKQITFSFILTALFALVISSLASLIISFTENFNVVSNIFSIKNCIICSISLFFFFIFNERFFSETFQKPKVRQALIIALCVILISISSFVSLLYFNAFLGIILISSIFDAWKNKAQEKEILFKKDTQKTYYTTTQKTGVKLLHKPNIYYLLLESYHSAEALKELYTIDDSDLDMFFQENGFTDYKNVYANRYSTQNSLNTFFNCQLFRNNQSSSAYALDVLRENGYKCEFFDNQYLAFGEYIQKNEFANFYLSHKVRFLYQYFAPLWGMSKYLRYFVDNIDPFNTIIHFDNLYTAFKQRLTQQTRQPIFYAIRFGADHRKTSLRWERYPQFLKEYPKLQKKGKDQIQCIVKTILEADSNALIIALGDHGAICNFQIMKDSTLNLQETLKQKEVSYKEYALDLFGTRCAIKWTHPHKTENTALSHVNIFPYIFESLGGGEHVLKKLQPNLSIDVHKHVIVQNNKVLETFPPIHEFYKESVGKNLAFNDQVIIEDCVLACNALDPIDRLPILEQTIHKFDYAKELQAFYIQTLHQNKKIYKAIQEAEKIINTGNYSLILLEYYYYLLSLVDPKKLLQTIYQTQAPLETYNFYRSLARAYLKEDQAEKAIELVDTSLIQHMNMKRFVFKEISEIFLTVKAYKALRMYVNTLEEQDKLAQVYYLECYCISLALQKDWQALTRPEVQCKGRHYTTWMFLFFAYAFQKNNRVDDALKLLLTYEEHTISPLTIQETIGQIAIKHKKDDAIYAPYRAIAEKQLLENTTFLNENGIFNREWYTEQAKNLGIDIVPQDNLYWHYITEGIYEGLNPVPWFNSFQYLLMNPYLFHSGQNPFMHFLISLENELVSPSYKNNIEEIYYTYHDKEMNKKALLEAMNNTWLI